MYNVYIQLNSEALKLPCKHLTEAMRKATAMIPEEKSCC